MSATALNTKLDQFMSPAWAARELWEHFQESGSVTRCLEPTCGDGRFLQAIPPEVDALGVELDPALASAARLRTNRAVLQGNILDIPIPGTFDSAVGNPPFQLRFFDALLDRLSGGLLVAGARCGFLVPAYFLQTPARVLRWNRQWSIEAQVIPRTLFRNLSKPLIWLQLQLDPLPSLRGVLLMQATEAIRDATSEYQQELQERTGTWRECVSQALTSCGGPATVEQICQHILRRRHKSGLWWREKVRQTLQRYFVRLERNQWTFAPPK